MVVHGLMMCGAEPYYQKRETPRIGERFHQGYIMYSVSGLNNADFWLNFHVVGCDRRRSSPDSRQSLRSPQGRTRRHCAG